MIAEEKGHNGTIAALRAAIEAGPGALRLGGLRGQGPGPHEKKNDGQGKRFSLFPLRVPLCVSLLVRFFLA